MKARSVSRRDKRRWPLEPLRALYAHKDDTELATYLGVDRRTVIRWKTAGLTDPVADEIATHVGLHPALIWPDWNAEVDITEPVDETPRRPIETPAPTPQPKQETLMNPDDILDAYDQLKQLLTRVDRPTIDKLLDRLAGISQAPAPRATRPKVRKKANVDKIEGGVGRHVCSVCGLRGGPRWFANHMRSNHWDDVIEALDADGPTGLIEAFGIQKSTAYRWRDEIQGVAA